MDCKVLISTQRNQLSRIGRNGRNIFFFSNITCIFCVCDLLEEEFSDRGAVDFQVTKHLLF